MAAAATSNGRKTPAKKKSPPKPKITVAHSVAIEVPVHMDQRYGRPTKDTLKLVKDGAKIKATVACRQDTIIIPIDLLKEALGEIEKKVTIA